MKKLNKDPFAEREALNYAQPIASREFILSVLKEYDAPMTREQLAKKLKLRKQSEKDALSYRLKAMRRDGQIVCNRKDAYGLPSQMHLISGHISAQKDGFGFFTPDEGGDDIFLNAREMRCVFQNDRVLISISFFRGRSEGRIVEVLERSVEQILGYFHHENGMAYVEPRRPNQPSIVIPGDKTLDAQSGELVIAKINVYPTYKHESIGEIIEVLGDPLASGMASKTAIHTYGLPNQWSEEVLAESEKFGKRVSKHAKAGRKDLTDQPFVTIDGEDAKDFDDAVYCQTLLRGSWQLSVAIADVSAYVQPDSALDSEAKERGNSAYFPDRVVPMLPETLSNGLCSLKPDVERLSLVCEMSIDKTGKINRYRFYPAVIRSQARLTYTKVQAMLEGDKKLRTQYAHVLENIDYLYALFQCLLKTRTKRGALDFDIPELKVKFNKQKKIQKIVPTYRNDAHRLIEECMLAANVCAADFLLENKTPALFRNHLGPKIDKLADLRQFLSEMGLTLGGGEKPTALDYSKLIPAIEKRPEANLLQTIILRSLSQAEYDATNQGHFGLAYPAYTHFTSPIRRYPDLLVHRAIYATLKYKDINAKTLPKKLLAPLAQHCSQTERRADEATRDALDQLKCEFMLNKLGHTYPGTITGVTHFGLFIMLDELFTEGLVHVTNLPNDYYDFVSHQHQLVGQHNKRCFQLGDKLTVKVARVDTEQRQIDFALDE